MTEVPEHLVRLRTESPMMPVQKMNVVPEELTRLRDIGNLSSEPDYEALMKARGPVRVGTELLNTPVLGTIGKTLGVLSSLPVSVPFWMGYKAGEVLNKLPSLMYKPGSDQPENAGTMLDLAGLATVSGAPARPRLQPGEVGLGLIGPGEASALSREGGKKVTEKVYRNSLGSPTPEVTISIFGAVSGDTRKGFFEPPYFATSSVSDFPQKKWGISLPEGISHQEALRLTEQKMGEIVEKFRNEGFNVELSKDGYGLPKANLVHINTMKQKIISDDAFNAKWSKSIPVYIRYGDLPKGGKSKNYRDNEIEGGVSVFRGRLLPSGEVRPEFSHNYEMGSFLLGKLPSRKVYVIEGNQVGIGSDGEPILRNVKKLTPEAAVIKYASEFPLGSKSKD